MAFWILPRFASGASRGTVGYAWLAFVLVNAGVLAVGFGALVGNDNVARLVGRGAECGAAVAFAAHAWRRIRAASA